jgi:hypothetical protein
VPVQDDDADRGEGGEPDDGPGAPEREAEQRERRGGDDRGQGRVPEEGEDDEPENEADRRHERRERKRDAAGRGDHLPALAEPEEHGPGVPDHRRSAGEDTDPVAADLEPDERGHEALRDVEQRDGHPERAAVDAPDVRGADVAAATRADVLPAQEAREHVAEGDRAEEVRPDDDQDVDDHDRKPSAGAPPRRGARVTTTGCRTS